MAKTPITTLDLDFQGKSQAIASYLIRHSSGAVLIECGPSTCRAALEAGLASEGLSSRDITHVLVTHIHLDHAGAAGWWSRQGAEIIVHPVGAPHLLNPERLLESASRIYGDRMEALWGEVPPVIESRLRVVQDAEEIVIGSLKILPVNTPGHAEHHYAYVFEGICFSGDVGGVRIPGYPYLRVPMPPPELHLERWHTSLDKLRKQRITHIAPTHFGIYNDPEWQLREVEKGLYSAERWLDEMMPGNPPMDALRQSFREWMTEEAVEMGIDEDVLKTYELANPLDMSADGLQRYWKKIRVTTNK